MHVCVFSAVRLFVAPWTVARQAPLSRGFSRQEHWNALPFPSSGDLPDPGIEPTSPTLAGGFFTLCHLKKTMIESGRLKEQQTKPKLSSLPHFYDSYTFPKRYLKTSYDN